MIRRILARACSILGVHTVGSEETRLLDAFLRDSKNVRPLITFYQSGNISMIRLGSRNWVSPSGRLTVEDDIYGYEVQVDGKGLIDCNPAVYGLTGETAQILFLAILGNIPGTTIFAEKNAQSLV